MNCCSHLITGAGCIH